ncbi:MAG: ankyrin repeat domain-containing protein [Gammaproteobacteria bacterium]|nr:ankyrin repeat domain-containing protein [Gammaproteobacteria bacterium]
MSLVDKILRGTDQDVAILVQAGAKLDEIDKYGYTPLVECAIVNSVTKAKLLLQAGAEVDFPDLTGRTALHWAADNGNCELAKLLLEYEADPNAYSYVGQPILATPILRNDKKIKKLLTQSGGSLQFAHEFINAKLIGHRFDLEGRADIVDAKGQFLELEFEGFYQRFSLDAVLNSLQDFKKNFGGKHLRKYFDKVTTILRVLQVGAELLKYQHYLTDIKEHAKKIDRLLDCDPLLLPISYEGHAINFIKLGNWLVRCDRGEYGRDHGTVIFYEIGDSHAFNKQFMKKILYKRQYRAFIDNALAHQLHLIPKFTLPLLPQISGNCSWANIEAVIPALMFYLLIDEQQGQNVSQAKHDAMYFFNEWLRWDLERAFYYAWQNFDSLDMAHKASRATMLAAILFQYCRYENHEDQLKAWRILQTLSQPDLLYILKSYARSFHKRDYPTEIDNLHQFLDDAGINIDDLR